MKDKGYLALLMDAPLQSWGYQSRFDRRMSLSYPTRSGIVGMLCAAMGYDRHDLTNLKQFADVEMSTHVFQSGGQLIDFHTVGGGWDKEIHAQCVVPKADGTARDPVVTYREYLQWAKFGVVLAGERKLLEKMAAALMNPKWGIWLGRKSCIPASPVYQGLHDSHEDALCQLEEHVGKVKLIIREVKEFAEGTDTIMDVPIDFARREFVPRRVCVKPPGGE